MPKLQYEIALLHGHKYQYLDCVRFTATASLLESTVMTYTVLVIYCASKLH